MLKNSIASVSHVVEESEWVFVNPTTQLVTTHRGDGVFLPVEHDTEEWVEDYMDLIADEYIGS